VIFFDPSVTLALESGLPFPYAWNERYPARIGVMPRDRTKGAVQWIDVAPFFYLHTGNAFEDGSGRIVAEGTFYDRAAWEHTAKWVNSAANAPEWGAGGTRWTRWTIDTVKRTAALETRDDLSMEFPTVNCARVGLPNRYTYAEVFPDRNLKHHAIAKYDGQTGRRDLLELGPRQMPGEPFFVADPHGKAEDDGWLFAYVSDLGTGRSELWILDAGNLRAKPAAVVELGVWVPQGVHGSWIADADIARRK
jgi:carotenoid cleavage dioxygenase-like enzyme